MAVFPPISEYAFLSDCETTALVSAAGAVEWMCVPRMDSSSVFAAVLDRGAGRFGLSPAGLTVPSARRYVPGSLVLETRHFTSSKVLCWVAADRGARLARRRGEDELEQRSAAAADEIKADVLARGVDERGVFRQHYDTSALDAWNLLVPLVRFLPSDDFRVRATVLAIAEELTADDLVLRYWVEETDDGLHGEEEGTFTICSFWLVSALTEVGELDRARRLCEKLLSNSGPLQLYAKELEPHIGRHLGNCPQAFQTWR